MDVLPRGSFVFANQTIVFHRGFGIIAPKL